MEQYRPVNCYQIYRVYGLVGPGRTHSTPLITALMTGKSRPMYNIFWERIRAELDLLPGDLQINQANFDFEPAAVLSFREHFGG